MTEKNLALKLDLNGQPIALTLVRATARLGARRGYMMGEAFQEFETNKEFPKELQNLRWLLYPNVIAGTESVEGMPWPLTFEEFIELPEGFIDDWVAGIYQVNPHWQPESQKETGEQPETKNSPKRKRH